LHYIKSDVENVSISKLIQTMGLFLQIKITYTVKDKWIHFGTFKISDPIH